MRKLELGFLALGVLLLAGLLYRIGWTQVLKQFQQVGWWFLLVLMVSGCRYLSRTAAWRRAFPGQDLPSFFEMFQVRLAGEALNYLSFAGPLLGEPTKAVLLRRRLPLSIGLGGTVLEAGAFAVTSGLVILVGLTLALLSVALDEQLVRAGWLVTGLLGVTILGLWVGLRRRVHIASAVLRWLARTPLRRWVEPRRGRVQELESKLFQFYRQHTLSFRLMFLWDLVAQGFALTEIYLILYRLGLPLPAADLIIVEAMEKALGALFFFVPGRVGTEEAGMGGVFELMSYGLALGVGLVLVQRLRAIVWTAAGLVFLSRYTVRRDT